MAENSEKEKQTEGLYLNIKINRNNKNGIYNYNSKDTKNLNTFIPGRGFLVKDENNEIKLYEHQKNITQNEIILFFIRIRKDKVILEKEGTIYSNDKWTLKDIFKGKEPLLDVNDINIRTLNEYIWIIINSDTIDNDDCENDDYCLIENEIIKFGNIKYYVREIHIENKNNEEKRKPIFKLIPVCKEYKKCNEQCNEKCNEKCIEHCNCGKERYLLCECKNKYQHYDEMNKWLNDRVIIRENKKKTVTNYTFKILQCKELYEKDNNCNGRECKYCNCKYDNTYYPIRFRLPDKKDIIDFYPIKKPENSDYLILESFEYINLDNGTSEKNIHIIKLNEEEDINIGRGRNNDVIIDDKSVSKDHATIRYHKEEGKLILKNKSEKSGTLILCKDTKVEVKKEAVYLQINNVYIEAKVMKENDFLKIKNNESIFPFPYEEEKDSKNKTKDSDDKTKENNTKQ